MPPGRLITRVSAHQPGFSRTLSTTTHLRKQHQNPPRIQIPDHEIKHVFILGGGSGGQVINKTSSAAQLTHLPTGIVVKSQATRSQSQNYKIARRILADKVDERLNGKESRVEVKRAKQGQRKASADKKKRRKYRALEEAKQGQSDADADVDGNEHEIVGPVRREGGATGGANKEP